jgi:hypothetical protein
MHRRSSIIGARCVFSIIEIANALEQKKLVDK